MNNDILILGKGFIGERLQQELDCRISAKRIESFADVLALIDEFNPKILINCIGHTGAGNVDGCEQALDKTLFANTYIPILLADICLRKKIKLVHISSGCIYHFEYGRSKPIVESSDPDYYELYYSRSKIYAENVLTKLSRIHDILIARIRVPLDNRPHPKNILTKLLKFDKIIDVPNSVTYIPDCVKALNFLIRKKKKGVYNIALKGGLRYKDLLEAYAKTGRQHPYELIKLKNLKLKRTNLILSTKKLEDAGFQVRQPKDIVNECVKEYIKHL